MAKYCPECGTKTACRFEGGRERKACPECGWIEYANTAIGVGALVIRDGAVLLVERAHHPVGIWTFPNGWIEQDDNIAESAVREVKEETGIDVAARGIVLVRNITKPHRNELYIVFLCESLDDTLPVPDGVECTQARFVHPDEFDSIRIADTTRMIFEEYQKHKPVEWRSIPYDRADAIIFAGFGLQ